jgi:hypothetical protein
MSSFAKASEAVPYVYPEFPAPEREHLDLSAVMGTASGTFKDLQSCLEEPEDTSVPVVQAAVLQDFKEVLSTEK